MAQLDWLSWQDQLEQAKHDGRVGDDDRERQSVDRRGETFLKRREVSIGYQTGIRAANCCDDCLGQLGISAGSFEVADRSVGVDGGGQVPSTKIRWQMDAVWGEVGHERCARRYATPERWRRVGFRFCAPRICKGGTASEAAFAAKGATAVNLGWEKGALFANREIGERGNGE